MLHLLINNHLLKIENNTVALLIRFDSQTQLCKAILCCAKGNQRQSPLFHNSWAIIFPFT